MQPLQNCIGPTIRSGREILCLPYAGFLRQDFSMVPPKWGMRFCVVPPKSDIWFHVDPPKLGIRFRMVPPKVSDSICSH